MLVLVSVKTGLYLETWASVVIGLRVDLALHVIFLVVPIVCACPAAWGIGNLNQTAAVEEEPCPSAACSMSPGAIELAEEEAFDRFRRLISVEAAVFNSELLCHRVGQFFDPFFLNASSVLLQVQRNLTQGPWPRRDDP